MTPSLCSAHPEGPHAAAPDLKPPRQTAELVKDGLQQAVQASPLRSISRPPTMPITTLLMDSGDMPAADAVAHHCSGPCVEVTAADTVVYYNMGPCAGWYCGVGS